MSLFEELKRLKVFKVATAYIGVGWLIMQAGDTMAPALHLPEWVNSLLAFFLILGFPLALFFARAYEMTPDGIRNGKEIDRSKSIPHQTAVSVHEDVECRKAITSESNGIGKWLVAALLPIFLITFGVYWWMGEWEVSPDNRSSITQAEREPEQEVQKPPSEPNDQTSNIQMQQEPEQVIQETVAKPTVEPLYEGINVSSNPTGASIFVDSEFVGVTPVNLKNFEAGRTATVRLQLEGYEPIQQVVTAPTMGSPDMSLTLKKIAQKYALTIETKPADAIIRILNITERYNPGIRLPTGRYDVMVSKTGYLESRQWVSIEDSDRQVGIKLEQEEGQLAAGDTFKDCTDCPEMVIIPSGRFQMGSPFSEPDRANNEGPEHTVNLSGFALGKYEVTFAEWDACVNDGGCSQRPDDDGWGRGQRPVMNVSWDDITKQYIPWINRKTLKRYRLPSEAEWEYAARAGAQTAYWWGNSIHCRQAVYGFYKNECSIDKTTPVGQYQANAFGLYDVHGNVYEWTQDCLNESYAGAPSNGDAWLRGDCRSRVLRGGSWNYVAASLRSAGRAWYNTSIRSTIVGFRLGQDL